MEIRNPRRVLAVSLEKDSAQLSYVVKDLTGASPEPAAASIAGTTHDLRLNTSYYTATVPVWLDLVTSSSEWAATFLSEEAGEVLAALGGVMVVFTIPSDGQSTPLAIPSTSSEGLAYDLLRHVGKVVKEGLGGWEWDGVGLAVGIGPGQPEQIEQLDDLCAEMGLEFVHVQKETQSENRNEFGEHTGLFRVKEALESNDWAQIDSAVASDFGDFQQGPRGEADDKEDRVPFDPETFDFGFDQADFEGMRRAIWNQRPRDDGEEGDDSDRIEKESPNLESRTDAESLGFPVSANPSTETKDQKLSSPPNRTDDVDDNDILIVERMMQKLQAAKAAGEGMSEQQRHRLASRAVREVMQDL